MRVLIIDDRDGERRLTCAVLKEAELPFEFAGSLREGQTILNRCKGELIDAVLLEAALSGGPLFEPLRDLRSLGFRGATLIVSGVSGSEHLAQAFKFGADDWIQKPACPRVTRARIEAAVHRRRSNVLHPLKLRYVDLEIDLIPPRVRGPNSTIELTARELDVLVLLATAAEQVMSRATLGRLVWNLSVEDAKTSMEHVVSRLRSKLAGRCSVSIATVRGFGWRLVNVRCLQRGTSGASPRSSIDTARTGRLVRDA